MITNFEDVSEISYGALEKSYRCLERALFLNNKNMESCVIQF